MIYNRPKVYLSQISLMNFKYSVLFLLIVLLSCQNSAPSETDELDILAKAYELQPNAEKANKYLEKAGEYVAKNKEDFASIKPVLLKASRIAYDTKQFPKAAGYLMPILQEEGSTEANKENAILLGDLLRGMRKTHAADIVYKGLKEKYPNDGTLNALDSKMSTAIESSEGYLNFLFDQVLVEPDEYGINRQNALKYVDGAEAYALIKPEDKNTPKYLYQAAEIARSLRTMPKAMSLYDWILDKYPDHEKSPTVMFIKGFILEQEFKQEEEAKALYQQFIERYPDHEMASSAKFLLENIGKSDEEILQSIEAKKEK